VNKRLFDEAVFFYGVAQNLLKKKSSKPLYAKAERVREYLFRYEASGGAPDWEKKLQGAVVRLRQHFGYK
jgi:hypothetical protein